MIGRPLIQAKDPKVRECVHHKDECRTNNDPANLEVLTFSEHRSHHSTKFQAAQMARLTEAMVTEALDGRSILEAAKHLGVVHQTLRNRFPHLVAPRKRKSPVRMHAPTPGEIEIVKRHAANPLSGLRECKAEAHMSYRTILRLCDKLGIEWVKKSKKGEVKTHYRGKPNPRLSAVHGGMTEPEPI